MTGMDMAIRNGILVSPRGITQADIGIKNGKIAALGYVEAAAQEIDASGLHILPGVIDSHVHFREPGLTHKEDIGTGSAGAILGGVTTIFDMPNTKPPTLTLENLKEKLDLAKGRSWCDYAFFLGASPDNVDQLGEWEKTPGCAGIKVFMGASTGNLLLEGDELLRQVLRKTQRMIAIHAEDEARLRERKAISESGKVADHPNWRDAQSALLATIRAVHLAKETGHKVHILHVTTAEEVGFLSQQQDFASFEITPQHLTLAAPDCYERLGNLAQMNPPIRSLHHQKALWDAIDNGWAATLGSDHAPHSLEEKAKPYPQSPSGFPGVQTLLPIMLNHVNNGKLSLEQLVRLTSFNPAKIFKIQHKGEILLDFDADLVLCDLKAEKTLSNLQIMSRCGYTPFDGMKVKGGVVATLLRGQIVMMDGEIIGDPQGLVVKFFSSI